MKSAFARAPRSGVLLLLAALTVAVYWPVHTYPFVSYDDQQYVAQNPVVAGGLSGDGLRWAFTSLAYASNWHPLTWISHMADVQLFGMNAGRHHLVNLLLHVANGLLLFLVLRGLTGAFWRSALAAALFAVHPLHLESVAWVAERKDVLSTFFLLLTLAAYRRYVRRPGTGRYLEVTAAFALGLLAKPMLVTLPCVLLLLDLWPLGRWRPGAAPPAGGSRTALRLLVEKLPWLGLAGIAVALTLIAQRQGSIVMLAAADHLSIRIAVALISAVRYLLRALWAYPLSVFHPFPSVAPPLWQSAGAAAALILISVATVAARRRLPFLMIGWLWFLGTLVPVIGLVKVGAHSIADRYAYVPNIGLFLAAVWGAGHLARRLPRRGRAALAAASLLLVGLVAAGTRLHLPAWRNSRALFTQALEAYPDSPWLRASLEFNVAQEMLGAGRLPQAVEHFQEGLRFQPADAVANYLLGQTLLEMERSREAVPYLQAAVRLNHRSPNSFWRLGQALARAGQTTEALAALQQGVGSFPGNAFLQQVLGALLLDLGRVEEASAALSESLRLEPASETTHYLLGLIREKQGDPVRAGEHFRQALRLEPGSARAAGALERLRRRAD